MSNTILVTCIYDDLHHTIFGGRLNRGSMYVESLKIIANTNLPIYCYTSKEEYNNLYNKFKKYKNIIVIALDLKDYIHHSKIQKIKNSTVLADDVFWKNRCAEIMYSKFDMLERICCKHPNKNIFWIDAGLSRAEILSHKFFNENDIENHRYYNAVKLFTPELFSKINEFINDKILLIESTQPHNGPIPKEFNINDYTSNNAPIGGLFGGSQIKLLSMIMLFKQKLKNILEKDMLFSEESIMAGVKADLPENFFKIFTFDSWYHEYWNTYNKDVVNFSSFFDFINVKPVDNFINTYQSNLSDIKNPIFCTLAIGEKYRVLSLRLLNSIFQNIKNPNIVIVTDDKEFYKDYQITSIYQIDGLNTPHFLYNKKLLSIKHAFENYDTNTIIYLDADCYIKNFDFSYLNDLDDGLNVNYNMQNSESFNNNIVKEKILFVNNYYNLDNINRIFKEQALIFKIYDRFIFANFLTKWNEICDLITANKLTHNTECADISIAATLTNFQISSISGKLFNLRESIYTEILECESRALI